MGAGRALAANYIWLWRWEHLESKVFMLPGSRQSSSVIQQKMDYNVAKRDETDALLIALQSVTLRVPNRTVFQNTDWQIRRNQHWAIVGPNGSGKSILASAIARSPPVTVSLGQTLYYFDSSRPPRSYFNEGEVVKVSPHSQQQLISRDGYHQARWNSIGSLDSPTVSEFLTGRSIEGFTPFHVGPTNVDEAVYIHRRDEAVALLGIGYLLERKVVHLSNGESRKILLARALMQSPELLILDDPFGGLDEQSRQTLKRTIDEIFTEGRMHVLLITARSDEIPIGITHIVRVANCEIVEKGPKETQQNNHGVSHVFSSHKDLQQRTTPDFPISTSRSVETLPRLIEMTDVSVSYGEVQILHGLTWQTKQDENWAIIGPNGSGKTTLLSLILADNPQCYRNQITLFGRRRGSGESIWEIKQKIGWVSPELRVHYQGGTTCLNVVCSGFFDSVGLYRECSETQISKAIQWMCSVGIAQLTERLFGSISVGEQRLVLLTRALVKNPILLILDEPCQGLDSSNRSLIIDLLDRLCQQLPVNIIYVTHHLDELPQSITHLLKLGSGCTFEASRLEQLDGTKA
ncbi:MAG: ATP-binding cassette domain-containing protein [Pseudomonadales bacterium]|jgi:molybdate transport system ATP-binding protein|nr:ATP-binding cassette domain-containing protein [Pseudomonadales bacterium]MDP7597397.1 ATP-binding cassette domain-containing protein [Pseudomonadales bacterium]HJN53434.1 ATP-binding cassette domain-containing protein [Pseudomonadales bacterium]